MLSSPNRSTLICLTAATVLSPSCSRVPEQSASPDARTQLVSSADGVPIAYSVTGDAPVTLVLVHGWSCDRTYWDAQVADLSREHRVVTVDLAGHGESGGDRQVYSIASFGADVAAVVDTLQLDRVVLIGHSMGGDVIMEASRLLTGRVAGLVWLDTYSRLPVVRSEAEIADFVAPFRDNFRATTQAFVRGMFPAGADTALVERVAVDMSSAPPAVALSALESALRYAHEIPAALKSLSVPVVAINPDHSRTDEASLRAHDVEPVIVTGVGHFLMIEDPTRFNGVLRDVVARLSH